VVGTKTGDDGIDETTIVGIETIYVDGTGTTTVDGTYGGTAVDGKITIDEWLGTVI
jgi:hypothetical protein